MTVRIALLLALFLVPNPALAFDFIQLWMTPDQQGRLKYEREQYQDAARLFENKRWKAASFYKAGDYSNAAVLFGKFDTTWGYFNQGNALAKMEKLQPAVDAYNKALALQVDFPEAQFNLDWVMGLLELSLKEYDDAGGTGGKLKADKIVLDERGAKATGEMSIQEMQAQQGLSDEALRDMWMRRVQTTPGDFLRLKFSYQLNMRTSADGTSE